MRTEDAGPSGSVLSDGLGLLPERQGQAPLMTVCAGNPDADIDEEIGHWYSPASVRAMLAFERERWNRYLCGARSMAEAHRNRGDDCGMLARALLDALRAMKAQRCVEPRRQS